VFLGREEVQIINRQFAGLRGLAMSLVVLHHSIHFGFMTQELGYPPADGWIYSVLAILQQLGVFAVPTFLFISGAFFSYAARGSDPPKLPWPVVWAGLKHLLWPYLFWSIAFYVVIYVVRDDVYTPLGYLKNLLVGFPFHFIPLIAFYYAISPILVKFAKRYGHILLVAIGFYQLILINLLSPGTLGYTFPEWMQILAPPILRTTLAQWGIYFPLGLVYGINAGTLLPQLQKLKWVSLIATVLFFVISLSTWSFSLAYYIFPLAFLFYAPTIKRNSIPMVRQLEEIGKRSYGLYLTHLIGLTFVFLGIQHLLPWLLNYQPLLQPVLFAAGLGIPLLVMNSSTRLPKFRPAYRYVFG
jgi:hypothetical protein